MHVSQRTSPRPGERAPESLQRRLRGRLVSKSITGGGGPSHPMRSGAPSQVVVMKSGSKRLTPTDCPPSSALTYFSRVSAIEMLGIENRVVSYFLEGEPATFYMQRRNGREGYDGDLTLEPTVIKVHGDISDIDRRSASQVTGFVDH